MIFIFSTVEVGLGIRNELGIKKRQWRREANEESLING